MNKVRERKISKILLLTLLMTLTMLTATSYAESGESVHSIMINKPEIYRTKGVTYVAAAQIFKALQEKVSWDQKSKQLSAEEGGLVFTLDLMKVKTIKGDFYLQKPALNRQGKFYIPLSFFAETLGYQVEYKDGMIKITGQQHIGAKGKYTEQIKEKRLTISAAGDFTLGFYKGQTSGGRFDEVAAKDGYSYFMKGVQSIFAEDDLTIANLEGPLTTRGVAEQKEFAIRGLPEYTKILTTGSVEVVNLANNHTYDYQKVGYDDTISALNKSGIGYFGEANTYYATINDIKVALIGAKGWSNSSDVKAKLKKRIGEAKEKAELVIVEFHWGIERENYPNAIQQDLGRYAIDQGANLVLGSHPHVIQGIGSYKGSNIVYSMGNFCFGANKNPADKDAFIYRQTFIVTDDGVQVEPYEVIPCSISSTASRNDYQPTILSGAAKTRVLNRLAAYSKNLKG